MSIHEALRAFFDELDRATWLEPDARLDAMGADAVRFIEERADEHFAALAYWRAPTDATLSTRVWITRDPEELARRWESEWHAERPVDPKLAGRFGPEKLRLILPPVDRAWGAALAHCLADHSKRAPSTDLARAQSAALVEELRAHIARAAARSAAWRASPFFRDAHGGGPFVAMYSCARGLAHPSQDPAARCPWLPLVALWNRGAWPFALPDATLGVYVPRGAAPSPDDAIVARFRSVRAYPRSTRGLDPNTSALGFGLPALPGPLSQVVVGPLAPPELPDR